jgi:hypothetical protein
MITPSGNAPAFTDLQRAALGGFLAGIALGGAAGRDGQDPIVQALDQDPAALAARSLVLADIAIELLPVGTLSPEQKAIYGREDGATLLTLVLNVTEALGVLAPLGVPFEVSPDQLQTLTDQRGAFESFRLLGMQITNSAMDQRALCGAFLAFLLDDLVKAVEERYHDAKVPQGERDALLDDFAPALLALDDILRYPVERKLELGERRAALAAEAADAQADAALVETTLRLRQEIFVPHEELFAAARRHAARTAGPAAAAPPRSPSSEPRP